MTRPSSACACAPPLAHPLLKLRGGGAVEACLFDFDGTLDFGAIEQISFADRSLLSQQQILDQLSANRLTPNADVVFGSAASDTLDALAGLTADAVAVQAAWTTWRAATTRHTEARAVL